MAAGTPEKRKCARCRSRWARKADPYCKPCRRAYRAERKRSHPNAAKEASDKYRESAKGKETRSQYRNSVKGQRQHKRYRRSEAGRTSSARAHKKYINKLRQQTAALPTDVVRPFVDRMLAEIKAEHGLSSRSGGRDRKRSPNGLLAEVTGLTVEDIYNIVKAQPIKKVRVDIADKLALAAGIPLHVFYERAEEWALLTGDSWPEGYYLKWE